jgi:hypothetical protein
MARLAASRQGPVAWPPMSTLLPLAALALLGFTFTRLLKREQALTAAVATLHQRIQELSTRVEAAEADVAHAVTQTEIAETLLLEKGVADEEDIEATRRRFAGLDDAGDTEERDELH